MPRRVQHPSGSLQYARGSLCGRRGTSAAARDLVREMGSLESLQKNKCRAPAGRGGLIRNKQSQISPHVENPSGISTNAAPNLEKPKTIGKAAAPSTAFSPRFRGARAHTPLAPRGARAAQPRGPPIARGGAMGLPPWGEKPPAGLFVDPPERRPDPLIGPGAAPAPI